MNCNSRFFKYDCKMAVDGSLLGSGTCKASLLLGGQYWRLKRFQAYQFDFRGKITFTRFDRCEFVKCTLLIDHGTEQLAFTKCVFKDCNIDKLEPDEKRGLYVRDNFFDRPLEERRAELEHRLAQALAARKAKGK